MASPVASPGELSTPVTLPSGRSPVDSPPPGRADGTGEPGEGPVAMKGAQLIEAANELPDECEPAVRELVAVAVAAFEPVIRGEHAQERDLEHLTRIGATLARAGTALGPVLQLLSRITAWGLDEAVATGAASAARATVGLGGSMARRLLAGVTGELTRASTAEPPALTGEQLARELLAGRRPARVAVAYAVFAVRAEAAEDIAKVRRVLRNGELAGALGLWGNRGGYLLVPEAAASQAGKPAAKLQAAVGRPLWIAQTWAPAAEVPEARRTVADVVSLAVASDAPAGIHRLEDFVVEYAALREPPIRAELTRIIAPVVENPVLVTTLKTFLKADGNRTRAADHLIVHRSTLDYRLSRIERVTGHQPTKPRGMQVLAVALATFLAGIERDELPALPVDE